MKRFNYILSTLLLGSIISLGSSFAVPTQQENSQPNKKTLTIKIKNIKEVKGQLLIFGYNQSEGFPKKYQYRVEVPIDSLNKTSFFHLPIGTYAIAIYHDINNNGKLDRNFIGIPTESYGFSNDAKPIMGPPKYKACTFSLQADTTIRITMK